MALLSLRDVKHSFGGPLLLDKVSFQVDRGERICLLGRNGEGKSTLLRILEGEIVPDDGEVVRQQGLRLARLPQDVPDDLHGTIAQVVSAALDAPDHHHPEAIDHRADLILTRMGLDASANFEDLSSGMKRRTLLARALVNEPDILLLDEPTNHLDIESIRWLEDFLVRFDGTLLFITHDRVFLERLSTRIMELDRGRLLDWTCDYPTFLKRKEELLAAEEQQNALFDKRLAQEETWIRKGIEARRTRNEGRVRALKDMREAHRRRRERQGTAQIQMQEADRSGALVIEARNVSFLYGNRTILSGLTTTIMRGDKVGIIGPNGSGKTTLLRLLLGKLSPSEGTIRLGTNIEISYFDQTKATLDEDKTVQQNISEYETISVNGQSRHVLGYLQDFLFPPERSRTLVKYLSGGERSRLLLAKLFTRPSNLLVLDEPTNDLDVETLELLESLLVDYKGSVLLVSHDRAFLNDVVTSTLVIDDGCVKEYEGGYDDYLRQSQEKRQVEPKPVSASPVSNKPRSPGTRKLSFQELKELQGLPALIEKLEASISDWHKTLADPFFYRQDGSDIAVAKASLESQEQVLEAAYARWEELESLRD